MEKGSVFTVTITLGDYKNLKALKDEIRGGLTFGGFSDLKSNRYSSPDKKVNQFLALEAIIDQVKRERS